MSSAQNHRRVALVLSTWSTVDRRWALAQLPQTDRACIQPLIDELLRISAPMGLSSNDLRLLDASIKPTRKSEQTEPSLVAYLQSLPTAWAARVATAWELSTTALSTALGDSQKFSAVTREIGAIGHEMPEKLAIALREISLRHAGRTALLANSSASNA